MSLRSAIMYLENALSAIENIKSNEFNYSLFNKGLIRQFIINKS